MGIASSESFVIIFHENMQAARQFYEGVLGLEIREVTYDWFVGYWVSDKHEMTLCISSSPEERARWGAGGKGVVIDFVVPHVDETYTNLLENGIEFIEPPTDKPWGLRTASLLDPAGYTLTITSYPAGRNLDDRSSLVSPGEIDSPPEAGPGDSDKCSALR